MPLTRLAAYVRALERRAWRAWATGRATGTSGEALVNLHAADGDDREGVFLRFLVDDGVAHELGVASVAYRSPDALAARLVDHATHTAELA